MQTDREFDKLDVLRLTPVSEIREVVYHGGIFEIPALSQEVKVVWVAQTLHEFELNLEYIQFTSTLSLNIFTDIFFHRNWKKPTNVSSLV